ECFVHTFGLPATPLTTAGYALGHDIRERYFKGQQRPLVTSVMNEFVPRTNTKAFETGRTNRIAWKIVRGLHCLRTGTILPERARIDGGFTCDKTTFLTQELGPRLHAGGFQDEWEGSLPMIFKTMTLIDESPEHTTYTYFLVCWEYLAYFLWFATKDGHLLQTA
ncbi:MAG TPA: hypothetical protein VKB93_19520, partial [Thermoanaerobaculia bacterium]|nr:hypothetical protein [Thermoanaerobaculia bacterium]